jgi:hypothetical protein
MCRDVDRRQPEHAVRQQNAGCRADNLGDYIPRHIGAAKTAEDGIDELTIGLRCAPETEPTARMIATRATPVAIAFSRSASPVSDGLSVCAAIPDPTTAMSKSAVPTNSARSRRVPLPALPTSGTPEHLGSGC